MRAISGAEYVNSCNKLQAFCEENGLRPKAMTEIRKLRIQLTNEMNLNMKNVDFSVDPQMPPPTNLEAKLLRQILLAGMGDQIARKVPDSEIKEPGDQIKIKFAYRCADMVFHALWIGFA
jgi:ATP-dependent RNA helicase DHX37/DHR1